MGNSMKKILIILGILVGINVLIFTVNKVFANDFDISMQQDFVQIKISAKK